ncbi:hypothetical protein L3Q82_003767 [Xyrichtys novacula]|uniref:G-protein coupled receptors family 1 profile domain-containing protein n=1 Tax=Xyrichtys novacula TaxID=13765 RepID=A0AAV1EHQ9_XYRNO|nr:hypothetical protein L3Q82_003767 [Xyrichtys novacula]
MSVNSSLSSSNGSLSTFSCGSLVFLSYIPTVMTMTILLPVSITVLYLGLQQWRRSVSSPSSVSVSDFFTYNLAVMELIGLFGYFMKIATSHIRLQALSSVAVLATIFPWNGQMIFPILTSVDRYLAVVHPITYLRQKQRRGVCVRNLCTVFVWISCCAGVGFLPLLYQSYALLPSVIMMAVFLFALIFCSVSVLRVLIRPGPGEASADRVQIHQSKRRAFNTILIIFGVLLLRFGGTMVCNLLLASSVVTKGEWCLVGVFSALVSLPSSLVLPLLFLHREGKLPGCRRSTNLS